MQRCLRLLACLLTATAAATRVGPCVQTVAEIIRQLHQVPMQHGIATISVETALDTERAFAAPKTPLMIFKRRFKDHTAQQHYLHRLGKAMRSERMQRRRTKRASMDKLLADCLRSVCLQEKERPKHVDSLNVDELQSFYYKKIGRCIAAEGDFKKRDRFQRQNENGACFTSTPGKVLIGVVDQTLADVGGVEECQRRCATAAADVGLRCASAMYYANEKQCILAAENKDSQAELFVDDPNSTYIHNSCVNGSAKAASGTTSTTAASVNTAVPTIPAQIPVQPSGYETEEPKPTNGGYAKPVTATGTTTSTNTNTNKDDDEMPFEANPDQIFYGIQTPRPRMEVVPDEVVDSYGMTADNHNAKQPPVLPNNSEGYRLFRDAEAEAPKCFRAARPNNIRAVRVAQTVDVEACAALCLKCRACLKGARCEIVGFSRRLQQCALAQADIRWLVRSGRKLNDFVFFQRDESCQ